MAVLQNPTRNLFFTGKGGVGNTSLACAAAIALADAGKRVLLVDDQAISLEILTRQLSGWQMEPVAVQSAREALGMVKRGEFFDLVILDQFMPEMDGLELADKLRALPQGQQLPMVMLSSLGTNANKAKERAEGGQCKE